MKSLVLVLSLIVSYSAKSACTTVKVGSQRSMMDQHFPIPDPIGTAERVVAVGSSLVALGNDLYTLMDKFKATVSTEYAPISVVPMDPVSKTFVSPYELSNFSDPVVRIFRTTCKNRMNNVVASFTYSLWFSYGGSYNGVGKYLTGVIVVPSYVQLAMGWTFASSMKVSSVMNHGTPADPIAGVLLTMKYAVSGFGTAVEKNDTIHIKGNGELRTLK